MVLPPGYDPGSTDFQSVAMTTSAKAAKRNPGTRSSREGMDCWVVLKYRIELSINPYHGFVIPLNYKSNVLERATGIEPVI